MWRNRLVWISLMVIIAGLLFYSSEGSLFYIIVLMAIAAVTAAVLLSLDARRMRISYSVRTGIEEGSSLQLVIRIQTGRVTAARSVLAEFEIRNRMFDTYEKKRFLMELSDSDNTFKVPFQAEHCGEMTFKCVSAKAYDIFSLFSSHIKTGIPVSCIIYPRKLNLNIEMERSSMGSARDSIMMQNRKGQDLSEMSDLRNYNEGDDIRSINWKLSSKMDELIVRQPSDPTRYNVALMPDIGFRGDGRDISYSDLNTAVALGAALCEQFIKNSTAFCLIIPTGHGLEISEIRDNSDLQRVMRQWLQIKIQSNIGTGMKYFMMENLAESFTRLIVISAGRVMPDLSCSDHTMSVMVINATDETDVLTTNIDGNCETVEFPSEADPENVYHIIC